MIARKTIIARNIANFERKHCKPHAPCQCCSRCCDRVICATQDEIEAVKKYLKRHHALEKKIIRILKLVPQDADVCPFLNLTTKSEHRCLLYNTEVRFHICKIFSCDYSSNFIHKKEKWISLAEGKGHPVDPYDLRYTFFGAKENWVPIITYKSKVYSDIWGF